MSEADNKLSRWDALLGISAEREAVAKAVAEERTAVVAWLREEYDTHSTQDAADHIERGEHRREEER